MRRLVVLGLLFGAAALEAQNVRQNPGFRAYKVPRNDDGSGPSTAIGFTINFFGKTRNSLWVNNNGNVTFDSALSTYTPFGLEKTQREIIAPFFSDVDTRGERSALVMYGQDTVNGRRAFGATFVNVGYYNSHDDKLNSFQVVLIERADTGPSNFDIEFNYDRISWETGDASGGVNGFGGVSAAVGWSNGSGEPGTSFELPGSRIPGSFLDNGSYSLVRRRQNSSGGVPGRYVFRARDGMVIPGLMISSGCPLPAATIGMPYRQQFATIGGMPPYRWSLDPDPGVALPGLSLSTDGVMTGTPTVIGDYSFTVRVTGKNDDGEETAVSRCSVKVVPQQLSITSACPLPTGTAGSPYSAAAAARGGSAPYTWSVTDGTLPPGVAIASNGTIGGTPTATGTYAFMLRVSAANPDEATPASRACSVTVLPAGLRAALACPLPRATTGVPYSVSLTAAGGTGPYTWSAAGALPSGLSLSPEGRIAGIPQVAAAFPFTLRVSDSRGQALSQACGITVDNPVIRIATACPLPPGSTGASYSAALAATGGSGGYRWSVAGSLPAGLSLTPAGSIAGSPLNAGAAQFRLIVEDSQGNATASPCSLTVSRGALAVTACPLPEARVRQPYSTLLGAAGGFEPYTWSFSGTLPAGLGFTSEGAVSGTPAAAGTFPVRLTVLDSSQHLASQSCNLVVQPEAPKIATACPLPKATLGADYTAGFDAAGGAAPYAWSAALPAGLALSSGGRITGKPLALGSFDFAVRVTDGRGQSDVRDCSLAVALPDLPEVRLTGIGPALEPAASASVTVELARAYSLAIQGVVSLSVTPDTAVLEGSGNQPDPRMRFARGQTWARFNIPAGSRSVTIPLMSTGTVAGTVAFRITELLAAGANVPVLPASRAAQVPRRAPVLTDACFTSSNTGIELSLSGYTTPRELKQARVLLSGASGAPVQNGELNIDVSGVASEWFSSAESVRFGGAFTLKLPLAVQGGASNLAPPTVTLSNSTGTSATRTAQRCQ